MKVPGRLVTVNSKPMHVFGLPQPESDLATTIVFLAGSGTPCPTFDFKPLWSRMSSDYSIAVVERPGYGWSPQTDAPRDIDTLLSESRNALLLAGFTPPYVLAAHSMSGLEALYWAQQYPNEVTAIIGLDMVVPQVYPSVEVISSRTKRIISVVKKLHLDWLLARILVANQPVVREKLLGKEDLAALNYLTKKQFLNQCVIAEGDYIYENARKVEAGECPSVPVLCILSDGKELNNWPDWGQIQKEYFTQNPGTFFVELNCGHNVHGEQPERIVQEIQCFLSK